MRFTVATYNIHKGFSHLTRRVVIHELRDKLHGLDADVMFLQEVQGVHRRHAGRYRDWPLKPQHEFIADKVWREVAYGRNAVTRHGHHGNAVLDCQGRDSLTRDKRRWSCSEVKQSLNIRLRKPVKCAVDIVGFVNHRGY